MTLKQLEAFYWAATCASFAVAADRLHLSLSSLSKRIAELESALGLDLFDRSGHRAALTPAGQALLAEGRHVLQSLDALASRVKRVATGWEGELRIAVSAVLPWTPLYDLIEDFRALAGATTLRFSAEVLSGNWDALASGRADLLIGADA
ncbi:LysR family transcriptional regulator, partial [Bordetella pertussis]